MSVAPGTDRLPPSARTLIALALLYLLNPLSYAGKVVTGGVYPDSVAYLQLAKVMVNSGQLFLEGWGHSSSGLILPPLYPALIAAVTHFTGDTMLASYSVSRGALLLAVIPLYLLTSALTNRWYAFLAVLVMQAQYAYLFYGTTSLTEAIFVCVLAAAVLGMIWGIRSHTIFGWLAIGVLAGILFLARQVGLFMLPLALAMALLVSFLPDGSRWRDFLARAALFLTGMVIVVAPYAGVLYSQTGQLPFKQQFSVHPAVKATGPAPQTLPALPSGDAYRDMYARRREGRMLLPDSSEMLAYVQRGPKTSTSPVDSAVRKLARLPANAWGNLRELERSLGGVGSGLATLALFALILIPSSKRQTSLDHLVLPLTVIAYLLTVSLFTGLIARYMEVVVPFAVIMAFCGAFHIQQRLGTGTTWRRRMLLAIPLALSALMVAGFPQTFASARTSGRFGEIGNPLEQCAQLVPRGSPVFSVHPLNSYLLGGTYRILPNDTLDKIATYGLRSHTRFIVLVDTPAGIGEYGFYSHAPWLLDRKLIRQASGVRPVCRSADGVGTLLRIEDAAHN